MSGHSRETCPAVGLIQENGSVYPGYFGAWPDYLFGDGGRDRFGQALIQSGIFDRTEFNWGGIFHPDLDKKAAGLLNEVQDGTIFPSDIGRRFYEGGIHSKDLFDPEASYLWVVESSYAYREALAAVENILPDLVKEAYDANPTKIFEVSDLGCGPGVVTARLIPIMLAALPDNVKLRLRMEDLDPLAAVTSALLACELKEKYGDRLDIEVKCRDIREADTSDEEPAHLVIGLLSVLSYLTIDDQKRVLERMNKMKGANAIFTGHVNGFDPIRYFLGRNNGNGLPFHGLRREWRFLTKDPIYSGVAIKMSRSHSGVYPDLQGVMEMYGQKGWNTTVEEVFTPENGEKTDLEEAKGVVLSLRRNGSVSRDL